MKHRVMVASSMAGATAALVVTAIAHGRPLMPQAVIPDAVSADPTHYSVEFENADVRVLRIRFGAHEKGHMHNHPRSVTVFLTDGSLRMTTPDGQSRTGTPKAGSVVWEAAGPHQPENVSNRPFEAIRIELKTPGQ